jgi:hypothetical protein
MSFRNDRIAKITNELEVQFCDSGRIPVSMNARSLLIVMFISIEYMTHVSGKYQH